MLLRRVAATTAVALCLAACAPLGPRTITTARPLYNEAIQKTEAQQLLLNVVRQRYNDPILFLDVTSISSGNSRSVSGSFLSKLIPGAKDEFSEGLTGTLTESPIVFYAPNNGEKFVRQILTPLDLRTLTLLLQGGWSVERVLLVAADSVNGLRNVAGGKGQQDYQEVAAALRALQRSGDMTVAAAPAAKDAAPAVELIFAPDVRTREEYQRACQILKFDCGTGRVQLRQGVGGAPGTVTVATRSLFSAIYSLAQGVDVPTEDMAHGVVSANRGVIESNQSRGALFRVRTSHVEPADAAVKVYYRNAWFYIPDTDGDSKTTFALLSILLMLQGGDTAKITPLVTLPAM